MTHWIRVDSDDPSVDMDYLTEALSLPEGAFVYVTDLFDDAGLRPDQMNPGQLLYRHGLLHDEKAGAS